MILKVHLRLGLDKYVEPPVEHEVQSFQEAADIIVEEEGGTTWDDVARDLDETNEFHGDYQSYFLEA